MKDAVNAIQAQLQGLFPDLIGLQLTAATPDQITARLTVRPDLATVGGVAHGGALMAFADTLGAIGAVLNLPPEATGTVTLESKTNFLSAAPVGSTIIGTCTPIHRGKRTMVWQTRITTEADKLIALVTQTQMVLA